MDVIVIDAGSAGSVVARRLADAGHAVTVLEAGGEDTNPAIHDPSRMGELWHSPEDWDYVTVPQPSAAGRRLHLPRSEPGRHRWLPERRLRFQSLSRLRRNRPEGHVGFCRPQQRQPAWCLPQQASFTSRPEAGFRRRSSL